VWWRVFKIAHVLQEIVFVEPDRIWLKNRKIFRLKGN
jgi:hypothetical protein